MSREGKFFRGETRATLLSFCIRVSNYPFITRRCQITRVSSTVQTETHERVSGFAKRIRREPHYKMITERPQRYVHPDIRRRRRRKVISPVKTSRAQGEDVYLDLRARYRPTTLYFRSSCLRRQPSKTVSRFLHHFAGCPRRRSIKSNGRNRFCAAG